MSTKKFTTAALDQNQYLVKTFDFSYPEAYCIGYNGLKRDRSLDGYYFVKELKAKDS